MPTQIPESNLGKEGGVSVCAITGAHVPLTAYRSSDLRRSIRTTKVVTTFHEPLRGQLGEVDLAVYPTISHRWLSSPMFFGAYRTRWLSARLNSYLSSRCLIRCDYTLLGKRVKQANSHIIGYPNRLEKKPCYPKCVIIKSLN